MSRPRPVCSEPGCPELQPCAQHPEAARRRAYDRERGSPNARGYGSEWRRIRNDYLRRHPRCECGPTCCWDGCGRVATDVDHIIPRPRGARIDQSTYDAEENLQALASVPCHRSKTMRETNQRRRGGGG
jgi:5-methylcytosine-specific restriction protein A